MKYGPNKSYPHPAYTINSNPDWTLIPHQMVGGLRRYVEDGIPPGHFLSAVLCNDLTRACERADENNRFVLFNYVLFFHNYLPAESWGSEENFEKWIDKGGLNGKEIDEDFKTWENSLRTGEDK